MKLTYKTLHFILILTILSWTSSAQLRDPSIIAKSPKVYIRYTPAVPVSKTAITFVKFKEEYGIQFSFVTPTQYMSHIYIESVDSFGLGLSSNKRLILNRPLRDTMHNESDGSYVWQIIFFIDKTNFEALRQNKIETLFVTHGGRPLELNVRRKSQTKVLEFASLF